MPDDIDNIKKLPAEERLKKLKEFSKKREEEIKAAQDLMKKSESELKEERETEEKIPIPQMISESAETLTTEEEREMFKIHHFVGRREERPQEQKREQKQTLEETIEKEKVQVRQVAAQMDYMRMEEASRRPVHDFYAEIARIKTNVEQQGYISPQQTARVEYITRAIEIKQQSGYKPEHEAAREATLTQKMGAQLQSMYRSQSNAPEKLKNRYQFTDEED